MPRRRLPSNCVAANLDCGPACIGVIAKESKISIGDKAPVHDSQPDTIDCLTQADDWDDRLGVTQQFEVRFRRNQTDLSSPSKKRLPAAEQLVGPLCPVFARGIAEVERQMPAYLVGDLIKRNESFGASSGLSTFMGH